MINPMIDTGALTAPDHVGDYVAAFRAGQALPSTAPAAPTLEQMTNALTGRLGFADSDQRDQAARRAELLATLGTGLSALPYAQRPSVLAHLAPALAKEGIPLQSIREFDPTDEALALSVHRAQAVTGLLTGS